MTRINGSIAPAHLIDQHLLAEYREIVRIPNAVSKVKNIHDKLKTCPKEFTLGKGHVLFFYDKIHFLHMRFLSLCHEMANRGYNVTMDDMMFVNVPQCTYNNILYPNLNTANNIVSKRIMDRISTMKGVPKINKKPIDIQEYFNLLTTHYGN